MTKKDYISTANLIKGYNFPRRYHSVMVETFIAIFSADNPGFDAERFKQACGVGKVPAKRLKRPVEQT